METVNNHKENKEPMLWHDKRGEERNRNTYANINNHDNSITRKRIELHAKTDEDVTRRELHNAQKGQNNHIIKRMKRMIELMKLY